MIIRDPEKNFEELWETFHHRYPFFELRKVDWRKQYDITSINRPPGGSWPARVGYTG